MQFKHKQLQNGLTLIGEIQPHAQTAAMGFFVRTGSRDETAAISGVSHFLEHMLFKGTETLSWQQVNEAFDGLGASFNAFTGEENTVYFAAVLAEYLPDVAKLWSQLMRPALREEDFNLEKNVILEEIAMYKDMPQFDVVDQARTLHFGSHPCGNSVPGTDESIKAMAVQQMRDYFTKRYAPNNLVVACCGNFDFDVFSSHIEQLCGGWQPVQTDRTISYFEGTRQKKSIRKESLARHHICLLSPSVSMQDPRRFAASLLGMILGDSTGSRYFWSLVDPAIAEVASMQAEAMDGIGAIYSYICCEPTAAQKVMDIVGGIFKDITENGVSEKELQAAKNKVLSTLAIKSEQPMGRLLGLGFNWVYSQEYRTLADDIAAIRSVTVQDVNSLTAEFQPGDFTCLAMGPTA
ncbi:MAG: insulinase family protein [Planctomycetes bacterium]|nr:insulinase family protein [Planctomycetota bacterium]